MGESRIPKRRYTKPSIDQLSKNKGSVRLPKLEPEAFNDTEDSEPGTTANTLFANPWTTEGIRLLPLSFDSWPKDALLDDTAFLSVYQNTCVHRIDRPKFKRSLLSLVGLRPEMARSFNLTFGWNPPAELLMWMEAEAVRNSANCPPVYPAGWNLSLQLCSLDKETIQKRNFFSWTKGDTILVTPLGLFTGLLLFGHRDDGKTLLLSALPGVQSTAIHNTDNIVSYLGQTRADSLVEFMLYTGTQSDQTKNQAVRQLLASLKKQKISKDGKIRQTLFARTRWLVALMNKGDLPESFEQMLLDAPDWNQWQEEKLWLGSYPFLANYWHMAHWFFGNEGACREAISLARKAKGSVTARLADITGRLLDGARLDLGALRADRINTVRKKIREVLEPRMLGPLAKATLERRALWVPTEGKAEHKAQEIESKVPHPEEHLLGELKTEIIKAKQLHNLSHSHATRMQSSSLASMELASLLAEAEKADAKRIIQALVDLTPRPMELGMSWGHAMKAAADLGLTSFAPQAMRYCRAIVENKDWDPHTDQTLCYCLAESARTAAMLIPDKAYPYLLNLLRGLEEDDKPRHVAIGALLLAGLLVLGPNDKKILALLELTLKNRTQPRSAYLYGAIRAIQTACKTGKKISIPVGAITVHFPVQDGELSKSPDVCEAAESAMEFILQNTRLTEEPTADSIQGIGTWLTEQIGYSSFLRKPLNQSHHWDGLIRLAEHGQTCTPELWQLMKIEHMHRDWLGPLIALARRVTPVSSLFEKLQSPDMDSIRSLLHSPSPELVGWLDFIAAWISLDASPASLAAVSSACTWRFSNKPSKTEFEEMLHQRLPLVLASFGKRASGHFERLLQKSKDEFNLAILQNALESMDEWERGEKPMICTVEQALAGVSLEYRSRFDSLFSRIELTSEHGKGPILNILIRENHSLLDDVLYPFEYSYSISFDDMDGIESFTEKLSRVCTILGYNLVE